MYLLTDVCVMVANACQLGISVVALGDAVSRSGGSAGGPTARRLPLYSFIFLRDDQQPALIRYF